MGSERKVTPREADMNANNPRISCQRVLEDGPNLPVLIACPNFGMCSRSIRMDAMPVAIRVAGVAY